VDPVFRDDVSAPFFDGTDRGELRIRRCPGGHHLAPDRAQCHVCGSTDLDWVQASGNARLVSWVVVHTRPANAGQDGRADVLGLVELEEGPWMHAALIGTDGAPASGLAAGQPMVVDFVRPGDGEALPAFRPV
jgi:uncharacterized OB-fold protein